jgi:hypothetical protein
MLGMKRSFLQSSVVFPDTRGLDRVARIVEITKNLNSSDYVNAIGGADLYAKEAFARHKVSLQFLNPIFREYSQPNTQKFVAGLSIIDLVMNVDRASLRRHLEDFVLL